MFCNKMRYIIVIREPDIYGMTTTINARKPRCLRDFRALTQVDNFGEGLRIVQDNLNSKNFYAFNPSFD